jgi:hypothetical protein
MKVNKTARSFDSQLISSAVTRLRDLLDSQFPQFEFLCQFEAQLSLAEHAVRVADGRAGKKPLRATKSIMAATLNAEQFSDIVKQSLTVDEDLVLANVGTRRNQQAARLCTFINEQCPALGLTPPLSPLAMCEKFIDAWQPTMCAPDEYPETLLRASRAKAAGELPAWFKKVAPKLEAASQDDEVSLPKKTVYEALALLTISDEVSLTPDVWHSLQWKIMRENLGFAAVKLANSGESAKSIRATQILEQLWKSGIVYAGVQLAWMYFDLISPKRLNKQHAEKIIDETYSQYLKESCSGPVFTAKDSDAELYRMYSTIKVDAIRHAEDPVDVERLTKQMLDAALAAAELRFEGFAALTLSTLVPDFQPLQDAENEEFFELRKKISKFPQAEAYCRQLVESEQVIAMKQRRWM